MPSQPFALMSPYCQPTPPTVQRLHTCVLSDCVRSTNAAMDAADCRVTSADTAGLPNSIPFPLVVVWPFMAAPRFVTVHCAGVEPSFIPTAWLFLSAGRPPDSLSSVENTSDRLSEWFQSISAAPYGGLTRGSDQCAVLRRRLTYVYCSHTC